jgi:aspartyl-tRNA(Asn)/glutamyl-tRNA(Gln) amidotransferase subunit B
VDLNRAGTPLLEIVTEPDVHSAAEAKAFLEELHLLLTYLGVSDCNMQEGSLRCDANVNLHIETAGGTAATPIVEIKNLNSFRGVEAAVEFEIARQLREFQQSGRKLGDPGTEKETRGWDAERNRTFAQRGKEEASDYRYFPDPDLAPVTVGDDQVRRIRSELCELPAARRTRFREQLGLSAYDAAVLINQGRPLADYFERVAGLCGDAKQAANWVTQDVLRELNDRRLSIGEFPIGADVLGTMLRRVVDGAMTVKSGRDVFAELLRSADDGQAVESATIDVLIDRLGLRIVRDTGALEAAIAAAIEDSPQAVADFRAGKQQALGAVIGKVMKHAKGADARTVRELLIARLSGGV